MLRKRYVINGALVVSLALSFGGVPVVARASTTSNLNLRESGDYSCVGPCATATYFSVRGIARPGSGSFATMTLSAAGTVLSVNPDGCLVQSENWAITTRNGKNTIYLSTTSDTFCPTSNPNVSQETATFTITGGTGLFSNATGAGTFTLTVLTHPQNYTGTLSGTITY
jgi:hypothetical protein